MTDNELRAHDLAIEASRIELSNHIAKISNKDLPADTGFDLYLTYKAAYSILLENLNKDFPPND